ncbi:uracil-DNA glycosylase family protein [Candidatus Ichthyocystis hellenicum]|uniref:uracil-DNA glycosylase family protein n=1 Tax=Candidatus Ichthyocystis hellenicum TaxID=1561003 RepID=UPI000A90D5FF|nr:uracil-DNA glycosylase [Candidatus Ichthyocystis hellenicum]
MNTKERLYYMGINYVWKSRQAHVEPSLSEDDDVDLLQCEIEDFDADEQKQWSDLSQNVSQCKKCRLCEKRKQAVLGVGDKKATWMFVGEAPGEHEDNIGEPFVGQAGQLLDCILFSLGLSRGKGVYIANAIKCRPPENRTPFLEEISTCLPYLQRQISLIKPKIIVALGRPATQALLGHVNAKLGSMRGTVYFYQGIPLVVTYHPAYLLRSPLEKSKVWEDMIFANKVVSSL